MFKNLVKSRFYIPVLISLFLCLLASRRWQQLVSPQVWAEDGTQILYEYIMNGWTTLWEPVNGYLVLVPKLISGLSLSLSFLHYPLVSTIITWVFIALVGVAITLSPTKLKGPFYCALAVFLVPTNSEVFGLPLYTFWWAAILLFLLVLWDEKCSSLGWRILFLLLGGLSSPIIVLVTPLLLVRAVIYREYRAEIVIAIIAVMIAAVQLQFILALPSDGPSLLNAISINIIPIMIGPFGRLHKVLGDNRMASGLVVMALMSAWAFHNRRSMTTWFLLFLFLGSIALVLARVDLNVLHPRYAGPRYFFYPYILLSWMFIQYWYSTRNIVIKMVLAVLAVVVLRATYHSLSRDHDDLHWAQHVEACRLAEFYEIPIHTDGNEKLAWKIVLPGKRCDDLLKSDLF